MPTHRLRDRLCLIGAVLLVSTPRGARAQADPASAFHTDVCPVPANVHGYPVGVRGEGAAALDPAYAMALAEAAARRWEVPSRRRASFSGLAQVRGRIVPPEPRWADDWFPGAEHVARLSVTLFRDGREPAVRVERPSGDRLFDRSLATLFGRSPYEHPLPPFPAGAGDSVRVRVTLGEEPGDSARVVRFAAQQTTATIVPGSFRPPRARRASQGNVTGRFAATVKYDVDAGGQVSAIQVLRSSNTDFAEAVVEGLQGAGFTASRSNCRPIGQSIVQEFTVSARPTP